ncbi:hypothetical protein [Kaistia terrae]|uniref:Rho termination factor N-terminal domain-containing protein n=1 Tax=Kaistia terrae TaxID=537017 RepID=A0ABW0Q4D5_9HYPH|nr:hypothetical protein [Kaistia terrae]MCX5581329.1 hypothetical protein [Kaistia terrae]
MAEISAIVVSPFKGVRDGEIYPRDIEVGDTVVGDLAVSALRDGMAELRDGDADHGADTAIVNLGRLKLDELKALAAERGIELGKAQTKAEIIAVLDPATLPTGPSAT